MKKKYSQEEIINHLKINGFFFQNSEIYGGLSNSWDFGPLGAIIKKNIRDIWWKYFILKRVDIFPLDSSIILNSKVWENSGHLDNFSDPLIDCKKCKNRFRVDKMINDLFKFEKVNENNSLKEMNELIITNKIKCPSCNQFDWTDIKNFNLMFETHIGTTLEKKNSVYLRPETAQGIFINFKNIQRTMRAKLPFGVAQIGKAFRNEITPSNFIYRTREFEQMEIEYFTHENDENKHFQCLLESMLFFIKNIIGLSDDRIKLNEYKSNELAHYSKKTIDIFFEFPHGWSELCGISNRGDFDLKNHSNGSNNNLNYLDIETNNSFFPSVIEPSFGLDRLVYALLTDSFQKREENNDTKDNIDSKIFLKINKDLCPYRYCILPLVKKLKDDAYKLFEYIINLGISCSYDDSGSIGKRYNRQDNIGTYECITYDYDSLNDNKITIRNRDTMLQTRIDIDEFKKSLLREHYDSK